MKKIFSGTYEILESFYGSNLASYLYGACNDGGASLYTIIGSMIIAISLVSSLVYYFVLAESFYKLKHWLNVLLINSVLLAIIIYTMLASDLSGGNSVCRQFEYDLAAVIGFSVVNLLYAAIIFFIFSLIFKRHGKEPARYTPF